MQKSSLFSNDFSAILPHKQPGSILSEKYDKYSKLFDYIDTECNFINRDTTSLTYSRLRGVKPLGENEDKTVNLQQFLKSCDWQRIKENLYIAVEECQKYIGSITFRYLYESKLTLSECHISYSKNLLINIKVIINQIMAAKINIILKQEQIQEFSQILVNTIDGYLSQILKQSSLYYLTPLYIPLTHKIQEAINPINRTSSQMNDVVISQDIKISKYLNQLHENKIKENQKYVDFVMDVINSSLAFLNEKPSPTSPENIYDIFVNLNGRLYSASQNRHFRKYINQIWRNPDNSPQQKEVMNLFLQIFDGNHQQQIVQINPSHTPYSSFQQMLQSIKLSQYDTSDHTNKLNKQASFQFANFSLPTKLPNMTTLIIMQEWISHLQYIFKNPQRHIISVPRFRNTDNQQIYLSQKCRKKLIFKIKKQKQEMDQKVSAIIIQIQYLKKYLLCNDQNSIYKSKIANLPNISAAAMASLMQSYLSILIHHLLRAGFDLQVGISTQNINLVSFKPTSLLTSKISCNEAAFISILNALNVLDRCHNNHRMFKLTKVGSTFEEGENSFTIKYQLYGKVECSLVISLLENRQKLSHYYNFSQFLKKISKFKFGVIISCAMLVSQNQPRCRVRANFTRKKKSKFIDGEKILQEKSQKIYVKNSILYVCKNCRNLEVNDTRNSQQPFCNKCMIINRIWQATELVEKKTGLQMGNKILKRVETEDDLTANSYVIGCSVKQDKIRFFRTGFNEVDLKYELNPIDEELTKPEDKNEPIRLHQSFICTRMNIKTSDQVYFSIKDQAIKQILPFSQYSEARMKKFEKRVKECQRINQVKKMILSENDTIDMKEDDKKYDLFLAYLKDEEVMKLCQKKTNKLKIQAKILNLCSLNLQKIDGIFNEMMNLVQIDLKQNQIQEIKLSSFPRLVHLNLSGNELESIDLKNNIQLTKIELSMNSLANIDLSKNLNLQDIDLSHNKLIAINLDANLNLLKVILNDNDLKSSIQFAFNKNSHLRELNLSNNNITCPIILKNQNLQHLTLNCNDITKVDFTKLKKLTFLNISEMQLQSIDLSVNINLTHLMAQSNKFKDIDLSANTNLTHLKLSQNMLSYLKVDKNQNLTQLQLHQNQISSLDISKNLMLTKLDLRKNKISSILLKDNAKLRDLNLSYNQLTDDIDLSFNKDLVQLLILGSSLKNINLKNNKKLKVIDIRNNKLTQIIIAYTPQLHPRNIKLDQIALKCKVILNCTQKEEEECSKLKDGLNQNFTQYIYEIFIIK